MLRLIAVLCLASTCSLAFGANEPTVTKAYADDKGRVHIVTADGRDHTTRPKKWQAGGGFGQIKIAPDGKTVGWLVKQTLTPLQAGASYSYAVALDLDIWRNGRVIRRFSSEQEIQSWIFLRDGNEVAFHRAPLHGQEFFYCTLFDVNTGREQARWSLDRRDYVVPDWAEPLLAGDSLPGPDEISNWFPDSPAPAKKAPHPKP